MYYVCTYLFNKHFAIANQGPGAVLVPGEPVLSKNTDQAPGLVEVPVERRKQIRKMLEPRCVT